AAQNPVLDFAVTGTLVPRRDVVDIASCQSCHGTFSKDFSIHGGSRNQTEYCVICHNPVNTDYARRKNAQATAASSEGAPDPNTESIQLKRLIHKIHTGEHLATKPYVVYGFGSAPNNFTPNDFGDVRFPRSTSDCAACHTAGTELLPLPADVLPTLETKVDTSVTPVVETVTGSIPPIQATCLACHDSADAKAHAELNTTPDGTEACGVCHEEGKLVAVGDVHAK
ncbi:MAG TPA: cytochrome c3 family protein, partial [Candidatus Binatia bacterium]|nr:cytochrome c3 family protein [Candidatus Binatia bacterium]